MNAINRKWFWFLLPALSFMAIGGFILHGNTTDNAALDLASTLSFTFGGVFFGLVGNYVTDSFGNDRSEWLPLAESSCKQIFKMKLSIDRYLAKESGSESFCATISDESTDKSLIKKHCDGVEMKLQDLDGDLSCMFSDWENFINKNCKDDQCVYIWARVNSIDPSYVDPYQPQSKN